MANLSMRSTIVVSICVVVMGITGACGKKAEAAAVIPSATPSPTSTSMPELILLPTVTPMPVPTVDPDVAFLEWLDTNGYEFANDMVDGSKRYKNPNSDQGSLVDVYVDPDTVTAAALILDEKDVGPVLYEITNAVIGAIESHGMDASSLQKATEGPYTLPLLLQGEKYVVVIKTHEYGLLGRVTFME